MDGQDNDSHTGILRQLLQARKQSKTEHGCAPHLPLPREETPAQAAATALGRTAERLYKLPVQIESATLNGLSLAELPEMLPEGALFMILQGGGDEMGVMALCREAVTALIEMQTCARVTSRPVPKRKLTRGDALMCADFANSLLKELAADLIGVEGFAEWGSFRYATFLDDPRPLELILEDKLFRSLTYRMSLGQNQARKGLIFIALPSEAIHIAKPRDPVTNASLLGRSSTPIIETSAGQRCNGSLVSNVQEVPVDVYAILCRRKITLGELRSLREGAIIGLPHVSLSGATLELPSGHILAGGKLGEAGGYQAIRLHDPGMPAREMADLIAKRPDLEGATELPGDEANAALPVDLDMPNEFQMGPTAIAERDMEGIPTVDSA